MPWTTPTLAEVRGMVRDDVRAKLPGADALVPNSVLRIVSDNQAGLAHENLQYIDWLADQLIPDTAETDWLDRHADIWLTNADGSTGRKMATLAEGVATFTSTEVGVVIPIGMQMQAANSIGFETTELIVVDGDVPTPGTIRALDPGAFGNLEPGTSLSPLNPPAGLTGTGTVVELGGGTNEENDDDLRMRVLLRIRQPPMGGSATDYVQWALAVPGVTRAWCAPNEMGIGTVTVRFLMDDLRADDDGWPNEDDIARVKAYIDRVRPVAVKDCFVMAPIKQFIDVKIDNLVPDNAETRAAIEFELQTMLREQAGPGQTIFTAWKYYAIMSASGVESFVLLNNEDDVMETAGNMAVLGDIIYG